MNDADRGAAQRAATATRAAFWIAGFGVAGWAPLIPFARQRLQVGEATLGLLLLCLGIGSVAAMLRTGPLCARHGCRPVVLGGALGMLLVLPLLAWAGTGLALGLALLAFGAALGSLDVAMNVHAVAVERAAGRPQMSGFHALFSLGGFAGAAAMTALLDHGLAPLPAAGACALALLPPLWLAARGLLPDAGREPAAGAAGAAADAGSGHTLAWPRGPVRLLAALAAACFLVEGALLDWGALLLVDRALLPEARAGLGFVLFSVAMTAGRLTGDALVARWGEHAVLRTGGLLALAGFGLLAAPGVVLALGGFALIGLGAANVVPVLFRRAGAQTVMPPALAVSALTTIGYAGYLSGPALVGLVSQQIGLPAVFWGLAALMGLVPLTAQRLAR